MKDTVHRMERHLLLLGLAVILGHVVASPVEEAIQSSMTGTGDQVNSLRFFGVTKTVATTTTVLNIQEVFREDS